MKKSVKNGIKIFACGALCGAVVLVSANNIFEKNIVKNNFDDFEEPKLGESFKNTKEVEEYTFKYYGQDITIQSDDLKIYSFDKDGNMKLEDGKKVEVPVLDNKYILDSYISEKEATVYNILENKDKIKDEFSIYLTFNEMEELYQEYLTRDFDGIEDRKEAIYNVCYQYVVDASTYTMGGKLYKDLPSGVKKDILDCVNNINYMKNNSDVKDESLLDKFIDRQEKVIRYELFKEGR